MKDIYENINRDLLIELQAIKVRLNKFNLINLINLDRNFYVFILIFKNERKFLQFSFEQSSLTLKKESGL